MTVKLKKYYCPYKVNSNVWFYKGDKGFEFHVQTASGHTRFKVQDRTLLSYITGKRKDGGRTPSEGAQK